MANLSHDDIEWASTALNYGTSLAYIASVLEVKERKAVAIINTFRMGAERKSQRARERAEAIFSPIENDTRATGT